MDGHEDLIAELAAINMALIKALSAVVTIAETGGVPRKEYLDRMLESGTRALDKTDYFSLPAERHDAVVEKARARYSEIIAAVLANRQQAPG